MDSAMIGIIASSTCAGILLIVIVVVAILAITWKECQRNNLMRSGSRSFVSQSDFDDQSINRMRPPPQPWMDMGYYPQGWHIVYTGEQAQAPPMQPVEPRTDPGVVVSELDDDRTLRRSERYSSNRMSSRSPRSSYSMTAQNRDSKSGPGVHTDGQQSNGAKRDSQTSNTLQHGNRRSQSINSLHRNSQSMDNIHHSTSNVSQAHSEIQMHQLSQPDLDLPPIPDEKGTAWMY